MAIVNAYTINPQQGGIISDEESWYLRMRRTHHSQHLYDLIPPERRGETDMIAVYGGVGHPEFHYEVVTRVRTGLLELTGPETFPATLEALGRVVLDGVHRVSHRYADDRLRFLYGFGLDDFNADRLPRGDRSEPIGQAVVKKKALKIAKLVETSDETPLVPANHVCLSGWDGTNGFQGFCIKEETGVLSFQGGGFESIGYGKYGAAMSFQKTLSRMTLPERNDGVSLPEGLLVLIRSIIEGGTHFGQIGGNYHLYIIDGTRQDLPEGLACVTGDRARLAVEITRAEGLDFLARKDAVKLLDLLLVRNRAVSTVEAAMFKASRSPSGLDLSLRGYKIDEPATSWKTNRFQK